MQKNKPYLFIEINSKNIIFFTVEYNDELDFKVLDSKIVKIEGITKDKISNIETLSNKIKENLNIIEKKLNFTFQNATIINDVDDFRCINVSGFKKLGGSQILNDDISFILNEIKKTVMDNEKEYSLIHLFNSNFTLDKTSLNNLPIGLYGNFYNHHLTFFLLHKNNLKNLKLVLSKCHINLERVVSKNFSKGLSYMKKHDAKKSIILIKIEEEKTKVLIFKNSSFLFSQKFNFGSNLIMKDVSKVCSIPHEIVKDIFSKIKFDEYLENNQNDYLDKKFFKEISFRKISINHLIKIIQARIDEILDIVYFNNINLNFFKNKNKQIYLSFSDHNIVNNLEKILKQKFSFEESIVLEKEELAENDSACYETAELIGKGWKNEAIPIVDTKKSTISKIFSAIFR